MPARNYLFIPESFARRRRKFMNLAKRVSALILTLGAWPRPPLILSSRKLAAMARTVFNGSSTEKGLPMTFSKTENVKWVASLPGPIRRHADHLNDRVFVSSVETSGTLQAICLDRANGKALWQHETGRRNQGGTTRATCFTFSGHRRQSGLFFYGNGSTGRIRLSTAKQVWPEHTEGPRPIRVSMDLLAAARPFTPAPYLQILQETCRCMDGAD